MSEAPLDAHVRWENGGTASLVALDGMQVAWHSSTPFPPGAPAKGTLAASGLAVHVKVGTSRLITPGTWEVRGRLVTATRAVIEALKALASG